MSRRTKGNPGYRLGVFVHRVLAWNAQWANKAHQRGFPRWVTKIPALLLLGLTGGLLIAGAVFMALFIMLTLFIGFYLVTLAAAMRDKDITRDGYHYDGPEGPGWYEMGMKVHERDRRYD